MKASQSGNAGGGVVAQLALGLDANLPDTTCCFAIGRTAVVRRAAGRSTSACAPVRTQQMMSRGERYDALA